MRVTTRTGQRTAEPDTTRLVRFLASLVRPAYLALARPEYEGMGNLPSDGPFIITPNHTSELDPLTIAMPVYDYGLNPTFLAKDSLFKVPGLGAVLRRTAQVPVHRGTADSVKALSAAQRHLAAGSPVIIYPEGTLTRDPQLWPMHAFPGAARLALAMDVPVIPVAHWGDQEIVGRDPGPEGKRHFRPFPRKRVRIRFGPAVDLSPWAPDREELAAMDMDRRLHAVPHGKTVAATGAIIDAITELLAQLRDEKPPAKRWDRRRGERR